MGPIGRRFRRCATAVIASKRQPAIGPGRSIRSGDSQTAIRAAPRMRCAKSLQMGCSPSDHVGWLFALSAMSVALSACSSTPPTSSNGAGGAAGRAAVATSGSANTTSSAGQTSNNAHGGGLNLSAAGSDPGSIVDPNDACGIGTAEASLKPVTLLIMYDRSANGPQSLANGQRSAQRLLE